MLEKRKLRKRINQSRRFRLVFSLASCICIVVILLVINLFYTTFQQRIIISPVQTKDPSSFVALDSKSDAYKDIKKILDQNQIDFISISVTGDASYSIILAEDKEVVITAKKNLLSQISSLQVILSRLTMEGKTFKRLDLRYDKPIIVF